MAFNRFWLVCNPSRLATKPPQYLHGTYAEAVAEAKRLAAQHPGDEFHVLASACVCVRRDVDVHEFSNEMDQCDGVPF